MRSTSIKPCILTALLCLPLAGRLQAQSPILDDYLLVADRQIEFGPNNTIAAGNVAINEPGGRLFAKRLLASGDGTHIVSDLAVVINPASMYSVYANEFVGGPQVIIRSPGEPITWSPPVLPMFPLVPVVVPGATDKTVTARSIEVLPPGDFRNVTVQNKAIIEFTGGTYNFNSLVTKTGAKLLFAGPTTLGIKDTFRLGSKSVLGPIGPTMQVEDVQINFAGTGVSIRNRVTVGVKIMAPAASFDVGFAGLFKGQVVVHDISTQSRTVFQQVNHPFPTRTPTATPTTSPTPSSTSTSLPTATPTQTATASSTATETPTGTATGSPTSTAAQVPGSATATPTSTGTQTPTNTGATATPTSSPTNTGAQVSGSATATPTSTGTQTPTNTGATATPTSSPTNTAAQVSGSATATPTSTGTQTPTNTGATATPTSSPTNTAAQAPRTATNTPLTTATRTATETPTIQSCSPGYWKNHLNWPAPYTPDTLFVTAFGVNAFPGETLLDVLNGSGGDLAALGRQIVGALLNSIALAPNYPLSTAQVIAAFQSAYASGDFVSLQNQLIGYGDNCPLP